MADKLKDTFLQRPFFESLAERIAQACPAFDGRRFLRRVFDEQWEGQELKARMRHAAEALAETLPPDYREALAILTEVERHFDGFDHLLFSEYVQHFGLDHFSASMRALERFTRSTSEFAIRPFIVRYPERTMKQMLRWSRSGDEKVRRLSSEGCRPRLPWAAALPDFKRDPSPILPILENLRQDLSEAVRRSVANNLGDIAKDNLALALELAGRWLREAPDTAALVKHALRGPLKKGEPGALALFGLDGEAQIKVTRLAVVPREVALGGRAELEIRLRSLAPGPQTLRLEYAIGYARPTGRTSRKVFQIRQLELAGGETLAMKRKLNFQDRSTRKHHPGRHGLELVVNGRTLRRTSFLLER